MSQDKHCTRNSHLKLICIFDSNVDPFHATNEIYRREKNLSTGDKLNLNAISWHFKITICNVSQMGYPQLPWEMYFDMTPESRKCAARKAQQRCLDETCSRVLRRQRKYMSVAGQRVWLPRYYKRVRDNADVNTVLEPLKAVISIQFSWSYERRGICQADEWVILTE
jgi:hypothetical protein